MIHFLYSVPPPERRAQPGAVLVPETAESLLPASRAKNTTLVGQNSTPFFLPVKLDFYSFCPFFIFVLVSSAFGIFFFLRDPLDRYTIPVCFCEKQKSMPQGASPLGEVDDRHPLVQAPALPAEPVQLAQGWVFPRR